MFFIQRTPTAVDFNSLIVKINGSFQEVHWNPAVPLQIAKTFINIEQMSKWLVVSYISFDAFSAASVTVGCCLQGNVQSFKAKSKRPRPIWPFAWMSWGRRPAVFSSWPYPKKEMSMDDQRCQCIWICDCSDSVCCLCVLLLVFVLVLVFLVLLILVSLMICAIQLITCTITVFALYHSGSTAVFKSAVMCMSRLIVWPTVWENEV